MRNNFWRVTLKYGYYDLAFDFEELEEASNFLILACTTYNQAASDDHKDLYVRMTYENKDPVKEEE